ncbi:MAG: RtcB family protein [Hyphomicrobiales bacterium]
MKQVISSERRPIKMWLSDIEEGALKQAKNLANLPFIHKHVALMPDCHEGYGMPIGGVIATKDVVIPNAVGVDIGCGMCAIKTNIEDLSTPDVKRIMSGIRKRIPLGFNWHKKEQDAALMPQRDKMPLIAGRNYKKALCQLGTLGGGNHFIEIQYGSDNAIWIMIHSGSRNIGLQVAKYYNNIARKLNERWHTSVPSNHDLAFLPIEIKEASDYLDEMNYCVEFAFANRKLMMDRTKEAFRDVVQDVEFGELINIAHNYACIEEHFKEKVVVHRKGATSAKNGEIGIIPGSQGTNSYIVEGKGNLESFMSCSHGAGRKLGRKQAQRTLDLKEEISRLEKKGVVHSIRTQKDLDEACSAYKDIHTVMENQKDLVDIKVTLEPLAVIKG